MNTTVFNNIRISIKVIYKSSLSRGHLIHSERRNTGLISDSFDFLEQG